MTSDATCRGCGTVGLEVVLDLGEMPLANGLLTKAELVEPEPRYPLALAFCPRCRLVQITETVDPAMLFREYAYFSSVSDEMVAHSARIAARMQSSMDARAGKLDPKDPKLVDMELLPDPDKVRVQAVEGADLRTLDIEQFAK
jgi:hypothetical protein